ncbi:ATP-dependent DNA helicase RecG [bacterium]|nr:MAG: ATP-dependent DNA helicase RecG [bacterium]
MHFVKSGNKILVYGKALDLSKPISSVKGIGPAKNNAFAERGINTISDLVNHYPRKYLDRTNITQISKIKNKMHVNLVGTIEASGMVQGRKRQFFKAILKDKSGIVALTWFRGARYMNQSVKKGDYLAITGKVEFYNGLQIIHPEYDKLNIEDDPLNSGIITPLYSISAELKNSRIDSRFLRKTISNIFKNIKEIPDFFGSDFLENKKLISLDESLRQIHFPANKQKLKSAIKRLKFNEHFFFQLSMIAKRSLIKKLPSKSFKKTGIQTKLIFNNIEFELTRAQKRVLKEIKDDLSHSYAMNRLLQGDVGSGKTIVSILASAIAVSNKAQVAIMAPTEILAKQHYNSFKNLADYAKMSCALLTGGMPARDRKKIIVGLENGNIDIVLGTHALIQKDIKFNLLGLAIIDEQHRFGVNQRNALLQKGFNPHLLSMTATPIPRTLAITYHGDMDLSIIDELPKNRIPITTKTVNENRLEKIYSFMNDEVKSGRQCIIVYPLIEETEKSDLAAAEEMYDKLKRNVFKEIKVGLIHGRLEKDLKDEIMSDFSKNKINIIISTTVIEVGIDVPNATVMLIEHAERFGLTQLHQLRGRVGRGSEKSYCILVQRNFTENAIKRLKIMESTNDGFIISDEDLKMRGPGEFFGIKQSGFFNFKIASITSDGDLITNARNTAKEYLEEDLKRLSIKNKIIYDELMSQYGERLMGLTLTS